MDSHTNKVCFLFKRMQNFVDRGRPSRENANCANNPFFAQEFETGKVNLKLAKTTEILENLPSMPTPLKTLYKIVGNPDIEYYFGEWTLVSLSNLQKRLDLILREGNLNVVDFAIKYAGMGHIVVCSYDPDDGKIFFRRDGGSNEHERVARWNFIKTYKPKVDKKTDINVWFKKVENENDPYQSWSCLQDPMLIDP